MAIQTFEETHHLCVTVHDLAGTLSPSIGRERFRHNHPLCRCVKESGGEVSCVDSDIIQLRPQLDHYPEGRYHVCHAGFVEWVVPVFHQLKIEWIIFAGIRMPSEGLDPAEHPRRTRWKRLPWNEKAEMPPPVDKREAHLILENLRQLCARLYAWAHQKDWYLPAPERKTINPENRLLVQRRILIRRFVDIHYPHVVRLKDIAAELKVSEDRASHLIHECCGQTFREILIDTRLKTAKELLRFSSLSVLDVALASGFVEITHFNRLFHRRVGMTPRQYRKGPNIPSPLESSSDDFLL